jgi:hypothetical protein
MIAKWYIVPQFSVLSSLMYVYEYGKGFVYAVRGEVEWFPITFLGFKAGASTSFSGSPDFIVPFAWKNDPSYQVGLAWHPSEGITIRYILEAFAMKDCGFSHTCVADLTL